MSEALRDFWDRQAQTDPLWAILTYDGRENRGWTLGDFMRNGEGEVAQLFQRLSVLGFGVRRRRALDFGCGVGRLSQALARRFDRVLGVDISPTMVGLAREISRYPSTVAYESNADRDLTGLVGDPSDFIYSNMVLQHMPPALAHRAIGELVRLLDDDGLLVFQLPAEPVDPHSREIQPMPAGAYQGRLAVSEADAPPTIPAGERRSFRVRVENASPHGWSQPRFGPLAIGNHWLDASGDLMIVQDDGREPILQVMAPGEACTFLMTVHAPATPGAYVLELDLVHEGMTWFARRGSPVLRLPVDVTPSGEGAAAGGGAPELGELPIPDYDESRFAGMVGGSAQAARGTAPMHGTPRTELERLVERHGGRIVHVEEDACAGPAWLSYRYFVRKDAR